MPYKTYDIVLRARGTSAAEDDPSLAATASNATFTIDGVTVNGLEKPTIFFQGTELSTLTAALKAGIVDVLDVATVGAATVTKSRTVDGGIGDFAVTDVSVHPGAKASEVWTITVDVAALPKQRWSVVGSTLGAQAKAWSGTPYDNGQIRFTVNDAYVGAPTVRPGVADAFTLTVGAQV